MKPIPVLLILLVAALAGIGGWFFGRSSDSNTNSRSVSTEATGKIYSCSMHPQIRSPRPGKCPICLMELAPIYSGQGAAPGEGLTMLGSNSITVLNVASAEVRRHPLHRTLRVAGMIEDDDTRHRIVSAYIDGRIDKLGVNHVGAEVVVGQPLATFYSPMLLAAEREYVSLFNSKPAQLALGDEHTRLVEAAGQRLKRYGLNDSQLAALPKKSPSDIQSELLAPVAGTVVARHVYEGQYVKEGDKLFELGDFSTMWFLFDAYERDLIWLKPGQKVDVTTPAVPGKNFPGTIAFIDPNLKEMTRSAKVRVELPNALIEESGRKRRELYHKLYAEAVVHLDIPEVLAISRSAVLAPGPNAIVYVDKGDTSYEQRHVKLGRVGDDDWEVLEGLSEGERVVTAGNLLIDAQTQLNSNSAGPQHEHGLTGASAASREGAAVTTENRGAVSAPPLTEDQRTAAKEFFTIADAITASLAADNLAEFNSRTAKMHAAASALAATFPNDSPWHSFIETISAVAHVVTANDLKAARKQFNPISEAVVSFAKAVRKQEAEFKAIKVYRCPMTKDAFPGAPRTAEWIQLQPQIHNPYFGAEMLDCGSEVKP